MFDGSTYQPTFDFARLNSQLERVKDLMLDGQWRTLPEIQSIVGGSEAGVSARLRDLRKSKFGGLLVNRKRVEDASKGIWIYQVTNHTCSWQWENNGQAVFL